MAKDFTNGPITSALVAMSVPIILANLLQSAYQMIDTFWVGRLGEAAVAAVSLTFPILFLSFSVGIGLSIAATVLVAQAVGRRDDVERDRIAAQSYVGLVAVSIIIAVVGYAFSNLLMSLIGAEGEVLVLATEYLRISFIGVPFLFAFAAYQSIVRGVGEVRTPLLIVFVTVLLNLVLDPLFIYGYGIIPPAGVAGAAIASVVTQAISAIIGTIILMRGSGVRLHASQMSPRWDVQRSIARIGLPSSVDSAARGFSFLLMFAIVATLGTTAIAAYGIGQRVLSFVIIPALGLSIGTSSIVGQNVGAQRFDRVRATMRAGMGIGTASLAFIGLAIAFFSEAIVAFFVPAEPAVIAMGAGFLRITAFTFGLIGIQLVVTGGLRGVGDARSALWITLANLFAVQLPLAWYLAQTPLAEMGVWIAIAVANFVGAGLAYGWYHAKKWEAARPARS